MEQLTDHHYEILSVPEDVAANCIYIRGPAKVDYLLHPTAEECPNSVPVSNRGCTVNVIDNTSLFVRFVSSWAFVINGKPFI